MFLWLRRRYLDLLGSIYIYNEHRGYTAMDRLIEVAEARDPDDHALLDALEQHRVGGFIRRVPLLLKLPVLFLRRSLPRSTDWPDAEEKSVRSIAGLQKGRSRGIITMTRSVAPSFIALLCLCMAQHRLAADPTDGRAISLDALSSDVVANNPERRFYADQIRSAGVAAVAAGRPQDPTLAVDFGERRTSDPVTHMGNGDGPAYSVSILQPIEFGGRIALRRAIAQRQVDLARIGLQQFDATLSSRARSLGYTLFAADEKADAARAVARRMRRLAQVVVARDPAGPAPSLEAAILDAGAITAERDAATADAEANSALYELNQLRGAPFPAHIRIIRPQFTLPVLPADERLEAAIDADNFELKSLRAQFEQQGLKVDLARKSRIPVLSVGPYYEHNKADDIESRYGVRATTTLPLWNSQAGDVANEQVRQEQANATLLESERRIAREAYDQAAQYAAKRDAIARWPSDASSRFAQAAEDADRNFRTGAIPISTYTEMQTQYLSALTAVLDTRREAMDALNQLRALNGGQALDGSAE